MMKQKNGRRRPESGFNRLYSMLAKMPLLDYLQDGLDMLRIRHVIEKRDVKTVK